MPLSSPKERGTEEKKSSSTFPLMRKFHYFSFVGDDYFAVGVLQVSPEDNAFSLSRFFLESSRRDSFYQMGKQHRFVQVRVCARVRLLLILIKATTS